MPAGAFLLCSVGRQVGRKGFAWFVRQVMPLLPPAVHYWVAGDGPDTRQVLAAIAEQRLGGRVRLLGGLDEGGLLKLYQGADLFVMPNIQVAGTMEGFGVVLLEAGLCGLPVVAADLEGICDVIVGGENGLLAQSGNPWAFAQAIRRCWSDRSLLERLAAGTRCQARHYSWPLVAQQHLDLLQQLTGSSAGVQQPAASTSSVLRPCAVEGP